MPTLEFFFDVSSPWTYLAFDRVERFAVENGCDLAWKPFLLGGVFNKVNPSVYQRRDNPVPVKEAYYQKDMQDWARYQGLVIGSPSVFPLNSVKAMRGCFVALEEGLIAPYARGCFEAYWRDDRDLSKEDELGRVAEQAGLDRGRFLARIGEDEIKQKLFATTDEAIARGAFGSPTFFLDGDDMYFGNDRLELIRAAIVRRRAA
jgi:2-hydroxychromene-2-carboxylate isomerase